MNWNYIILISMMVKTSPDTQTISSFINDLTDFPYLAEEKRNVCEGILGYDESYNVLQTFQKIKSPGNDGLTVQFFLAFWPLFRKLIADSLNYAFEYSKLSNSQKQAVITLKFKRKEKTKGWRRIGVQYLLEMLMLNWRLKLWQSVWKRCFLKSF